MNKVLVSACLLGKAVRHDGRARTVSHCILACWQRQGRVVAVCPEVDAGLSVPRKPAEIVGGQGRDVLANVACVNDCDGDNVTRFFQRGAHIALALCQQHEIGVAVLTDASPSCGSRQIYDGRFSGTRKAGEGVTTALLRAHGVQVFSEEEIVQANRALEAQRR